MAKSTWLLLLTTIIIPIAISFIIFLPIDHLDPAPIPEYPLNDSILVPDTKTLEGSERIGERVLVGPEDLAYDGESGYLYTGCADGWIRRVRVRDLVVEDWVRVGGRPLGVALGPDKSLIVADAMQGLLMVKQDGSITVLTDEADGLKFGLTDGVDVTSDGTIYFTDASWKYNLHNHLFDFLSGRPYGRLLSFDPSTNLTSVLAHDLYFANGVALSPDQQSVIFCETVLRRCKRYYIAGDKKGMMESFIDNLPGFPDNIRYDGEGHYWVALAGKRTFAFDMLMQYPFLRKLMVVISKYVTIPMIGTGSGVMCVTQDGKPVSRYSDTDISVITVGLKIGNYLYYGSIVEPYMSRIIIK